MSGSTAATTPPDAPPQAEAAAAAVEPAPVVAQELEPVKTKPSKAKDDEAPAPAPAPKEAPKDTPPADDVGPLTAFWRWLNQDVYA